MEENKSQTSPSHQTGLLMFKRPRCLPSLSHQRKPVVLLLQLC